VLLNRSPVAPPPGSVLAPAARQLRAPLLVATDPGAGPPAPGAARALAAPGSTAGSTPAGTPGFRRSSAARRLLDPVDTNACRCDRASWG